jgi:hypothetical protein
MSVETILTLDEKPKHNAIEIKKVKGDGALMALVSKGAQDAYMDAAPEIFDITKEFLSGWHKVVYQSIDYDIVIYNNTHYALTFKRTCDAINHVDIALYNPLKKSVNELIKSIETEVGGQRIDRLHCDDLETQINTNCYIYGGNREITQIGDKLFIPLIMAPFHENNLVMPSAEFHELKINIDFQEPYESKIDLFAKQYYLDTYLRRKFLKEPHQFITYQNQFTGPEKLNGVGTHTFNLNYNHPIYLIYFWGFDKTKITNIRVTFNNHDYYNGGIEELEYMKKCRGLEKVEPVVIFFSQEDLYKQSRDTVNFSRIDYAKLLITTTETEPRDIYIVGQNLQPIRFMTGMYGLAFSK